RRRAGVRPRGAPTRARAPRRARARRDARARGGAARLVDRRERPGPRQHAGGTTPDPSAPRRRGERERSAAPMTIRVVIAHDHLVVRTGLRAMLGAELGIDIVGEASTGAQAIDLADRLRPDVVLMDLRMPEIDGAAATARIRARHPHVHVLVLTTYDTDA